MTTAYHCETCNGTGHWRITRQGDVVTTWACADHLHDICEAMQRPHEITHLDLYLAEKAAEWAQVGETLRQIAEEGA